MVFKTIDLNLLEVFVYNFLLCLFWRCLDDSKQYLSTLITIFLAVLIPDENALNRKDKSKDLCLVH